MSSRQAQAPRDSDEVGRRVGRIITTAGSPLPTIQDIFLLIFFGNPQSGDVVFPLTINGSTQNITIPYQCTGTQLKSLLESHSQVNTGDVILSSVTYGLPHAELAWYFDIQGVENEDIEFGSATNNLEGGFNPHPLLRYYNGTL